MTRHTPEPTAQQIAGATSKPLMRALAAGTNGRPGAGSWQHGGYAEAPGRPAAA
jgi:hypothetical protein